MTELEDWLGTTRIKNDVLGRAKKVTYPDGRTIHYGFDENLRLAELKDGDRIIRYTYDQAGRLDDGYEDDDFENDDTLRPLADMLMANDVMVNNHRKNAFVSNIDMQMLLLAAETGDWQYYMSYLGNIQSLGVQTYDMCEED